MIIGIDASRANNNQKTGVEWYAYHLIQKLKTQNSKLKTGQPDIRFVLYTSEPLQGELAQLPESWSEKVLKWPLKKFWTQIRLSWEMLFHPPDVLFIPAHVFPIIHPRKTAMTIHDIAAVRFPQSYNWFERWYSVWSAKYAVKKLWRVIVPSEFTRHELVQTFKRLNIKTFEHIFVAKHGYDERYDGKCDKNINEILKKYRIDKPFIVTIGRLEEKKNTRRIIEAFNIVKGVKNLKLLLVGKPGYGYEKVKEEIEKSPYKKDIIELGWVGEDLPRLLQAAEVFVFPSLYEGFGLPVLEAMAGGIPAVVSDIPSLKEIGGEAPVYVDQQNPEQMARGILELIKNEGLRTQKIRLGLERVKEFSWEKCAQETWEVLAG